MPVTTWTDDAEPPDMTPLLQTSDGHYIQTSDGAYIGFSDTTQEWGTADATPATSWSDD